jgi:hypothetical protein
VTPHDEWTRGVGSNAIHSTRTVFAALALSLISLAPPVRARAAGAADLLPADAFLVAEVPRRNGTRGLS